MEESLFDNYTPLLNEFKETIVWDKSEGDKYIPRPKIGLDPEIDSLFVSMDAIKKKLTEYLYKVRDKLKIPKIEYAHNRKYVSKDHWYSLFYSLEILT
jgi:hypothetical protein